MAELKPAYLISGEDEARIDAWRARLRARVAAEGDSTTLEILRDERLSAATAAEAIRALTLSVGRRYVLADGVERWSERDVTEVEAALAEVPEATVVVFIAFGKAPKGLEKAIKTAGGELHEYPAPAARQYPAWVREHARELQLELDQEAAEALVARAPRDDKRRVRQQSLMRELEKLAIYAGEDATVDAETVALLTMSAVEARTYELADAVIEGNRERALSLAEELRNQEEDLIPILYALRRQLRNAYRAWAMVNSGRSVKDVQSSLRVPTFVARRLVSQTKDLDGERFERAFELLADLDYAIRGAGRLDPESTLTLTLLRAT
jgi:DNA polymerase III subunit delta